MQSASHEDTAEGTARTPQLFSCEGRVDLSLVASATLPGWSLKGIHDRAPVVELPHGEAVLKLVAPIDRRALQDAGAFIVSDASSDAAASVRQNVIGAARFKHDCGIAILDLVQAFNDLNVAELDQNEVGDGSEAAAEVVGSHFEMSSTRDWGKPEHTERVIRVWVPRLDSLCWVQQVSGDGKALIKWGNAPLEGSDSGKSSAPLSDSTGIPLAPTASFVVERANAIPAALIESINHGLDQLCGPPQEGKLHELSIDTKPVFARPGTRDMDTYANMVRHSPQKDALFAANVNCRDNYWRDLIDPELCLLHHAISTAPSTTAELLDHYDDGDSPRHHPQLRAFDVDVDAEGRVAWASWVHHLDDVTDRHLKHHLADLLSVALPSCERACGLCLRGLPESNPRRLQVVIRSYEQVLESSQPTTAPSDPEADQEPEEGAQYDSGSAPGGYKISNWHVDGCPDERIVATAVCYLDVTDSLIGGNLVLAQDKCQRQGNTDYNAADAYRDLGMSTGMSTGTSTGTTTGSLQDDDDCDTDDDEAAAEAVASGAHVVVRPRTGTVVAFANTMLQHKVGRLTGMGRRRIVTFNVVHPNYHQWPAAHTQPRQLRAASLRDAAAALCRLRLGYRPLRLVCEYAVDAPLAAVLLAQRDAERHRRLNPNEHFRLSMLQRSANYHGNFQNFSLQGLDRDHRFEAIPFPIVDESDEGS